MPEKLKKILSKAWVVYLALVASYLFKGVYAYGLMANYMPTASGSGMVSVSGSALKTTVFLAMCLSETLSCVVAAYGVQFLLERTGRAFMARKNFVLSVCVYTALANVVLGIVGLTYFISPIIYVFVPKIASIIIYTAAYGVMFWRMRKTDVIPEYMVARAFMTMAVPYFAVSAALMF